ncbi:MAG: undecaprenyldiphospho-muramoylpentapeptide beta-N-acetylglucosaminyltransferase [Robiginitomaculum sp.]|nr:MAG: undecaprenyldiphospho-muramoylpentapeptide beta-N-acetylglucosaminyltransferase [Robiginitomaculum sp.]
MSKRILLAAGGTGGHMFPAQALAECLKNDGWQIAMMTDARGRKHVGNIPADPVIEVQAATISPRRPVRAIGGMWKLMQGVGTAKAFIKDWQPDVVVGFGGYPAFPALKAAQAMKIPTILHDQNAVLGRVNRVFARKANMVISGFDILEKLPAGIKKNVHWQVLGNPLRANILAASQRVYQPPGDQINLLIVGGSLGARLLCETVPKAVALLSDEMRKRLSIVQQTRPESLDLAREIYAKAGVRAICEPFFSDIETHLAKAHYIIARAGASSVSEIMAMGLPSLLVPLKIAMDDHQTVNALPLKNLGAADILPEFEFTPDRVKSILTERLNDSSWLETASGAARSAAKLGATTDLAKCVTRIAAQ